MLMSLAAVQIDQFEAEIETLGTGKKKKSRDNADQIEEYQNLLERHRDHVQKLETLLRMLDNDNVNIDQVRQRETARQVDLLA